MGKRQRRDSMAATVLAAAQTRWTSALQRCSKVRKLHTNQQWGKESLLLTTPTLKRSAMDTIRPAGANQLFAGVGFCNDHVISGFSKGLYGLRSPPPDCCWNSQCHCHGIDASKKIQTTNYVRINVIQATTPGLDDADKATVFQLQRLLKGSQRQPQGGHGFLHTYRDLTT